MVVKVHLEKQSEPIIITNVDNAYEKGGLYCVMLSCKKIVYKFPICNIFRITEDSTVETVTTPTT